MNENFRMFRVAIILAGELAGFVLIVASTLPAAAQNRSRTPHLAYAYPAGCERGMSCEITLGGQYLQDAREWFLTGDGVQIEVLDWYKPMDRGQYGTLIRRLSEADVVLTAQSNREGGSPPTEAEVAEFAGITPEQLGEMEIFRQRDRDPKRQPNDQLEENVRVRMTVDADAEIGKRELRLIDGPVMSNPIWIHVGRWREVRESLPGDIAIVGDPVDDIIDTMPIVINGQIMPGQTDRFAFDARKGMKLVVQADAREVIPYLADAVPGWFQAVLRLTDSDGREVAYADSFHFRQDPVMYFVVPRDGRYVLEIRDALYRGREDFVYRMTIGEIPFVTGIFPLGAPVDTEQTIQIRGWNLTHERMTVKTMKRSEYRPVLQCRSMQSGGISVAFPLQVGFWPEVFDREPNNQRDVAQVVSPPKTINGRINYPGDEDVYKIEGGGRLIAEIIARRIGSPVDAMLRLTDAQGNEIAFNDDREDLTLALQTHHADSHLTATLAANREHYLHVTNAQHDGGSEFTYRLSLHPPQPDFELRVTPSNVIAKAGQVVPIEVFVMRKDGFDADIELALIDPPPGTSLSGNVIPGDINRVPMTLSVPRGAKPTSEPVRLAMQGSSLGSGHERGLVRSAVPAENMMQAFIWHHLVPVENWNLTIDGRNGPTMPFEVGASTPRLSLGRHDKEFIPIIPKSNDFDPAAIFIETIEPSDGVSASIIRTRTGGYAIAVEVENEGLTTGDQIRDSARGNLLFGVFKEITATPTEDNPAPAARRIHYGYLPAIPFEISKHRGIAHPPK